MALFNGNWFTPSGGTQQSPSYVSTGQQTKTPQQQSDEYEAWLATPAGQKWNTAQEAAAAYARAQSDAKMSDDLKRLRAYVDDLKSQGRTREAEIALKQGEARIAAQRFEWEKQTKAQELGLSRAEAYAKFASSPDMMFARNDLLAGLSRVGQGLNVQSYASNGTPHANTYSDFEAIAGSDGSLAQGGSSTGSTAGSSDSSASGSGGTTSATSSGGTSDGSSDKDHRLTAANNVMKAAGMSEGYGTDENDQAALSAIENIYKMKRPGSYARLRPGQQAAFSAGLSRLGYWAPDALADMDAANPGQRSVRAA